jgi:predicted permease
MLFKYPGLTVVSVLSMATAVAATAGFVAFTSNLASPKLPLDEGDRLVAIQNWDVSARRPELRSLWDFARWRDELQSMEGLGAFKGYTQNLTSTNGQSVRVRGSEITVSAFVSARVPPLLGRSLVEADEEAGAENVAVIGYDLWRNAFGGVPSVVGSTVRLGRSQFTIVGVMPKGFRFPYIDNVWIPLRDNPHDWAPREGPPITIVGRLREGFSLEQAQAELTAVGLRTASEFPATHGSLRPRVTPYAKAFVSLSPVTTIGGAGILLMLLIVVCANVGTLAGARNAAREGEIAVRSALGASKSRIVAQLFTEALALAALASTVGLGLTIVGLRMAEGLASEHLLGGGLPFWWRGGLAPNTIFYVVVLAALSAIVSGWIPALRVTSRPPRSSLQRFGSGDVGLEYGSVRAWAVPALIVVALPILALFAGQIPHSLTRVIDVPALDAEEYLTAVLRTGDWSPEADAAGELEEFAQTRLELERRLLATPGVDGVTFASALPATAHVRQRVEIDGAPVDPTYAVVPTARVAPGFFEVLRAPILLGREFGTGDVLPDGQAAPVVIVNESFARKRLGDRNALGRRIRIASRRGDPGPWSEIVGVVADLGMSLEETDRHEGVYFPLSHSTHPVSVAVHVRTGQTGMVRLREIGIEVDPTLDISQVKSLREIIDLVRLWERLTILTIAVPALVTLLLAASGIFALMSFTVSRRTREIGIRRALGARPGTVVFSVLSGVLKQAAIGVGIGVPLTFLLSLGFAADGWGMLVAAFAAMLLAGLIASVAPTWRALSVQPTEAIKDLA